MSYLIIENEFLNEDVIFTESLSDYILSLTEEDLNILDEQDIYDIYEYLLEVVGSGYDHRFSNMFINHRQRTEAMPIARNIQTGHIQSRR